MVKTSQIGFAALLLLSIFTSTSSGSILAPKEVKTTKLSRGTYDRYLLATSWAGTTCIFNNCTHGGKDKIFNLHGLWPSTAGQSPEDCSKVNFKEQNLSPYLQQNLFDYWNSYYHDNWEFLDHEITKHGSCWNPAAGDFQQMDQQLAQIIQSYNPSDDYSKINTFLTLTVQLSELTNPYTALADNNIVPGDQTYNIDDILNVFANANGMANSVIPVCLAEKSSGNLYLAELRFCIDLNFKPLTCDPSDINRNLARCRTSDLVYPPFPSF